MLKRLTDEQMTEVIWNMGTDLEAKGLITEGGISQLQRFQAVTQAQLDKDRADALDMYEAIRITLEDYRDKRAGIQLPVSTHTFLLNALAKWDGKR